MFSLYSICGFFQEFGNSLINLWHSTGIYTLVDGTATWQNLVMVLISFVLVYLAIVKKFEPLLLLPIAFGMFIVNIPGAYRILFGDKGYIVTDVVANVEVARGNVDALIKLFGVDSLDAIKDILAGTSDITLTNGLIYKAGTLEISTETVIGNYGLFYDYFPWYRCNDRLWSAYC